MWRRKWQPTPVFLPEKSHGQSSLKSSMGSQGVGHNLETKPPPPPHPHVNTLLSTSEYFYKMRNWSKLVMWHSQHAIEQSILKKKSQNSIYLVKANLFINDSVWKWPICWGKDNVIWSWAQNQNYGTEMCGVGSFEVCFARTGWIFENFGTHIKVLCLINFEYLMGMTTVECNWKS